MIRERKLRRRLAHLVHRMGPKIVQRDDACDDRSNRSGNLGIADVRNVLLTLYFKMVNFSLKCAVDLGGGA